MTQLAAELAAFDLAAQADLVRRGEVSPLELVDAAIERMETVNPMLNAVVTPLLERARAEATNVDLPNGPLRGVPYLLKDLGATLGGTVQTSGSRAFASRVSPSDSTLTARLRAAGAVIVGKTSTPEFGNHSTSEPVLFGPARNPWAADRTTGGSSGGSAAAVAARMVPAAHGNDGAGSIRIPASCCGLFGLKPSRGRNSWAPRGDTKGLSVEHAVTRTVADSALLLDVTSGPAPGDPYVAPRPDRPFREEVGRDPGRLRIAWTAKPPFDTPVDATCVTAVREAAELLASLGHELVEDRPAFDGEVILEPFARVWAIANLESHRAATRFLGREPEPDELEQTTWELVDYARRFDPVDLLDALEELTRAAREIAPFFERYDAALTPTLARPPERLGVLNQSQGGAVEWWTFDCRFNPWNPIANLTGQPAASVPFHWTADGLPVGVLLFARYGDEATLFRLAGQIEAVRPWADRLPPIHA